MHVLITGGTGFIGKALCEALIARGDRVSVLTRDAARAARRVPGVRALTALDRIDDVDALVNLAGENLADQRWTEARKQLFQASRVDSTRRLLDALQRTTTRPRVLVSGSAIGWYGARGDELLNEYSASGRYDEYQSQLCRAWEAEARRAEALGVRVCLIRTGLVLERDGGPLARMLLPFRLGLGGRLGDGRQWMSWVHRADHVALMLWLIDHDDCQGPYNATAPQPVTNADFTRALAAALHRPALLPMPAGVLRLLVGEMAELLLTGQRVLPSRTQESGFVFRHPELGPALRAILQRGESRNA